VGNPSERQVADKDLVIWTYHTKYYKFIASLHKALSLFIQSDCVKPHTNKY